MTESSPPARRQSRRVPLSTQNKAQKPIKLATHSEHAAYFMPMLESFAEHGDLNEVVKNCVVKSCDLLDAGVPLFPNDFRKEHDAGSVRAEYEAYSGEELEIWTRPSLLPDA